MKKILAICLIAALTLLTSCASLYPSTKKFMAVEKGMTKSEVTKCLGHPQYRSFDRDIEIWEFRALLLSGNTSVAIVHFIDGKVERMDTFEELERCELRNDCHPQKIDCF